MKQHRKHFVGLSIVLLLAALALPAVPAQAESWNQILEFEAPFAFVVNDTTLPAGTYLVETAEEENAANMRVRTPDADKATYFLTRPLPGTWAADNKTGKRAKVVFAEHEGQQILAEVWVPSHSNGRQVVSEMKLDDAERTEISSSHDEMKEGYTEE